MYVYIYVYVYDVCIFMVICVYILKVCSLKIQPKSLNTHLRMYISVRFFHFFPH